MLYDYAIDVTLGLKKLLILEMPHVSQERNANM